MALILGPDCDKVGNRDIKVNTLVFPPDHQCVSLMPVNASYDEVLAAVSAMSYLTSYKSIGPVVIEPIGIPRLYCSSPSTKILSSVDPRLHPAEYVCTATFPPSRR